MEKPTIKGEFRIQSLRKLIFSIFIMLFLFPNIAYAYFPLKTYFSFFLILWFLSHLPTYYYIIPKQIKKIKSTGASIGLVILTEVILYWLSGLLALLITICFNFLLGYE